MSLDLHQTAAQLQQVTGQLHRRGAAHQRALATALGHLAEADAEQLEERRRAGRYTWLVAGLEGGLAEVHEPGPLPGEYAVVAVDGSHIDVDRHSPAPCYLINTGHVYLRYGELAEARLWSTPILYTTDEELMLQDPSGLRELPVEGPLLGVKRAVQEMEALADLVAEAPRDLPVLALLDGSLILWGLSGLAYPEFVRQELLTGGLVPALERLRALTEGRILAVASYVSLPRSADVVNVLRLRACPYPTVNCDHHCHGLRNGERPCDEVAAVTDRELFASHLAPWQRSPLYRNLSSIMDYYGDHRVFFWYINGGQEIARVEMPAWSTAPDTVSFAQSAIIAQVEKGLGYPVALSEAHEQAVVTTQDREHFRWLIEEGLEAERLPVFTSEKARSKRTRFL